MAKLTSGRVKKTPPSGITSDRYQFLGLEQAEPSLGDPLVGPSSIGANPIKVGAFYQLAAIGEYPGERYWSTQVGIGTTLGIISVYANGELPNNAFGRIHGLNFVGNGVTVETPSVNFIGDVGIATVRFTVTDVLNQGEVGQVLYNGPDGIAIGATSLNYYNNNVGIGTSLPNSKLEVIGDVFISGVVTASNFYGNLSGTATTSTNVIGGIGSVSHLSVSGISTLGITSATQLTSQNLSVSGVSTLGFVTATDAFFIGSVTATRFYGDVAGFIDSAVYSTKSGVSTSVSGGIASVTSLRVSGISTLGFTSTTQLSAQNLSVSGVSSLGFITATDAFYTGVVTATRFYGDVTGFIDNAGYAKTAGVSTSVIGGIGSVTSLSVSGFSTLSNVYVNDTITGPSTIYIDPTVVGDDTGKVVIKGNLEVKGTTTTIESQTLTVVDKNIELATGSTSDSISDGGGITLKGTTDHTIIFNDGDNAWQFSENLTPSSDNSKDLGISSKKWNNLYVNNIYSGFTSTTNLRATGISTLGITSTTQLSAQNLSVSGVSTLGFVTATDAFYTGVVTATRFYGDVIGFIDNAAYAIKSGVSTNVIGGIGSIGELNVSGISTLGNIRISSGIVSATVGIATYYGNLIGTATYATNAGIATNLKGGGASQIPYQTAENTTAFILNGTPGQVLKSNGTSAPTWDNITNLGAASTISILEDSSNKTQYLTFVTGIGDTTLGITTTSKAVTFNPSTGNLGIGTTNPGEKLQVDGNIRVGISTTSNYIAFRGTYNDDQIPYTHTYIGERIYDDTSPGEERSELLLFKGNDPFDYLSGTVGPDRIRLAAGELRFDTIVSDTPVAGTFEQVAISTNITNKMILTGDGNLGIGTTSPSQALHVQGNIRITGGLYASDITGISTSGTSGQLLQSVGTGISWANPASVSIGSATYASTAGIATEAIKLQTPRSFAITGDIVGSGVTFDGTNNVSIAATIKNNVTLPGNVTIGNDLQVNNNLNVTGNITIGGTTAYITVDNFRVSDADIILGFTTNIAGNDVSNDTTANHGGIAIASTEGSALTNLNIVGIETLPVTYKKIMWFKTGAFAGLNTDAWLSNYAFGVGTTSMPAGARFAAGNFVVGQDDITAVRNINSTGIITATEYYGVFKGSIDSSVTLNNATYATNAGIATYATNAGIATNLKGGTGGSIPYQTAADTTALLANGISGYILQANGGTNAPTWVPAAPSAAITGLTVRDEGNIVGTASSVSSLNFVGSNIIATSSGVGATITISDNLVGTSLSISGISTLGTVQIASLGLNVAPASGFELTLGGSTCQLVNTVTAASGVYTLDVTAANEFVTAAAIAGATTINLSNLTSLPSGYRWRGVLSFAYTSGVVSFFTGNTGYTVKWDGGTAPTLTASDLETVVITVTGGVSVIEVTAQQGRA